MLGRKIRIVSDHKVLSCLNLTTRKILRWILIFSKHALKLPYIKDGQSVVGDTLSRVPKITTQMYEQCSLASHYVLSENQPTHRLWHLLLNNKLNECATRTVDTYWDNGSDAHDVLPFTYDLLSKEQLADREIAKRLVVECHA